MIFKLQMVGLLFLSMIVQRRYSKITLSLTKACQDAMTIKNTARTRVFLAKMGNLPY